MTFDRDTAEAYADDFERAILFEEGENVSELVSTVATRYADELRAESEDALAQAEVETRIQIWLCLEEWAKPLNSPDQG